MNKVTEYAKELIGRKSITPDDAGCQDWLAGKLKNLGFNNEPLQFAEVKNLWSRRGRGKPLFVFAGHTDVVPTGPLTDWQTEPFVPTIKDGLLYGRGSADMKSSIGAMLVACENFLAHNPKPAIDLAFLITADEEGPAVNGTVKVVEVLEQRGEKIDWALVGEPTAINMVGDVIKNGRRGSLNGKLEIKGVQGHVAYPHLLDNPVHNAAPALAELATKVWDNGNEFFPPTSFQIANINAGAGAENVTPGKLQVGFNFRFSTENTADSLRLKVEEILERHKLDYHLQWRLSGNPFLTPRGALVDAATTAIKQTNGVATELSTSGGTSDGRFIAKEGVEVLELGPVNATIHQVNENINLAQLETLAVIYEKLLENLNLHVGAKQ